MPAQFLAYLHVSALSIKELRAAASKQLPKQTRRRASDSSPTDSVNGNLPGNMHLSSIRVFGLLVLNLWLVRSYPVRTGLTDTDVDMLKVLLRTLEDSVSEQTDVEQRDGLENLNVQDPADEPRLQTGLDEAAVRELLSIRNLKNVRNDSSKKSSGCFGRRMDRIGSMSSLGCNTVGRFSPK
ncbi:hypothetical protein Q5P01_007057 [Channa striata]|uniref:B-type natriuretic peptide n=1 Tax=Channa striata TaxID=64152 RepID=A0AA88SW06_CHASR|nr:hypothetical protein Q5P01_007057 [Channa striata]